MTNHIGRDKIKHIRECPICQVRLALCWKNKHYPISKAIRHSNDEEWRKKHKVY